MDFWLEEHWDDLWQVIQTIVLLPQEIDDLTLAMIAVWLIEDLLSKNVFPYIDRMLGF